MTAVTFYFQIHQPYRFRPYTVFDLGANHLYEDAERNAAIMRGVADLSYLPMNDLLLSLIKEHKGAFKVSFSISGTALDQFEEYAPEVLRSFKALAKTGCVEFIGETCSHSLAFIFSRREFAEQVGLHRERLEALLGVRPVTFRNTELIYNNELARSVRDLGYEVVLTEGADHLLGWRSPNYVYQPVSCDGLRLLLRNYNLSDDIAFRFADTSRPGFPLTADTFASWLHASAPEGEVINLFMDYETFGEHLGRDTGIFDFMRALPAAVLRNKDFVFMTPSEAARAFSPAGRVDVPQYVSWADAERDLTAWLGNDMQLDAMEALYRLESAVAVAGNPDLLKVWRRLQTSDHFYYMSTKWLSDGETHTYFNPYPSPYDAYINFMNVLADFEGTVTEAADSATGAAATGSVSRPVTTTPNEPRPAAEAGETKKRGRAAKGAAARRTEQPEQASPTAGDAATAVRRTRKKRSRQTRFPPPRTLPPWTLPPRTLPPRPRAAAGNGPAKPHPGPPRPRPIPAASKLTYQTTAPGPARQQRTRQARQADRIRMTSMPPCPMPAGLPHLFPDMGRWQPNRLPGSPSGLASRLLRIMPVPNRRPCRSAGARGHKASHATTLKRGRFYPGEHRSGSVRAASEPVGGTGLQRSTVQVTANVKGVMQAGSAHNRGLHRGQTGTAS